jgi:hypothetical protein
VADNKDVEWMERAVSLERKLDEVLEELRARHLPQPKTYSQAMAAKIIGISPSAVRSLISSKKIKTVLIGKRKRVPSLEISRLTTPRSTMPPLDPGPAAIEPTQRPKRTQDVAKAFEDARLLREDLKGRRRR